MVAAFVSPAAAQDEPWARREQNIVQLDSDIWPVEFFNNSITSVSWGIPMQFMVHENVGITAGVNWALVAAENCNDCPFGVFGNIPIGAYYTDTPLDILNFWAGGDISIPTHLASVDDLETAFSAGFALGTRAGVNSNRFAAEFLPLRFGGGIELHPIDLIYLRSNFLLGPYIPLDSQDFQFVIEWPTEFELRGSHGFGGGIAFNQVFPLTDNNDVIQLSLEWFLQYWAPGPGFHARVGWLWALDETLGFAFDQGKVMSGRISLGGHW
jgi:hypothetical protein